jgi:hypothetical protein
MNDINAAQRLRVAAADKAEAAKIKVSDAHHTFLHWLCSAALEPYGALCFACIALYTMPAGCALCI